ncbi:rhodanese-like domain-containing protein [bacterium]|nr:rhodanese-like domain-containing protein [bacterium]MBU1959236.1 rhodanese-like domain-containing protein [bacterium]
MIRKFSLVVGLLSASLLTSPLSAVEVNIKEGLPHVDVDVNGKAVRIQRIQDTNHKLTNSYTKTSRPAPPFSIQPFHPIKDIETISELDVIDFIKNKLSDNTGIVIDARMPKWHQAGTIPGSVNIPFSILSPNGGNPYIDQIFGLFGADKVEQNWNFKNAQTLLIFDNGPWCQQGVRAMQNLVKLGYPKSKILYYRGGMQYWQILGLSTIIPK